MSRGQVMIEGTLKLDGTLELDQKPGLPPGRVQVTISIAALSPREFLQLIRKEP